MNSNPVLGALADLYKLEQLYRDDPASFSEQLDAALKIHPHAQILKFWHMRLHWGALGQTGRSKLLLQSLGLVLLLGLCATLLAKIPTYTTIEPLWFYPRFAPLIVLTALGAYLSRHQAVLSIPNQILAATVGFIVAYLLVLPDQEGSSSVTMSLIHIPLVLWCGLGYAFSRQHWRKDAVRLAFLRYNGEVFVYTVLILLGGIVLTGASFMLFELIGMDIEDWYARNVIVSGLVCAPLVATFVYEDILQRASRIASLLARVFAPLFLVMVCAYLVAMLFSGQSPWTDRDFLISFDGLLILVLGIAVFCISDRDPAHPSRVYDVINFLLIVLTQAINLVALSAILYRLAEFGVTPNRVVVIGANILIFLHLSLIITAYIKVLRGRAATGVLERAVVRFIPVYGVWAVFVCVGLPVIFSFA